MVIYFYVTYKQLATQSKTNLMISLMGQVFGRSPDTPQALLDLQRYKDTSSNPPEKLLKKALLDGIRDFVNDFVVLDGLDECPNAEESGDTSVRDERIEILRLISFMLNCELENLHVAVFSRPEPNISGHFNKLVENRDRRACHKIDLSNLANALHVVGDIEMYIDSQFKEVGRNEWGLVDGRAPADVGSDSGDLPASHEGPPGQDSVIVASHFSLVEYLISDRLRSIGGPIHDFALNQAKANFHVAVTCLRYLGFMVRTCKLEGFKFVPARFPLTHYTIQNGFWYTNTSGWEKWPLVLCRLVAYLLPRERSSKTFKTLMRLLPPPVKKLKPMPSLNSAILYSISQSLWHVALFLIEQIPGTGSSSEAEVDDLDSDYLRSPLSWAAGLGSLAVVDLLVLKNKANPSWRDKLGDTPLSCAAQGGHEGIVERLLEQQGVDPNTENAFQYTPMHEAAENGHTGVVVILHKRHAHLNTLSVSGQRPLMLASIEGHNETVEYLLSIPRANTNVKDEKSGTPLSLPDDSEGGHEEVEVETRDYDGRTSLS